MNLKEKKVMVLGLARTGWDCARFLVSEGARVLVTDLRSEKELKQAIEALEREFKESGAPEEWNKGD